MDQRRLMDRSLYRLILDSASSWLAPGRTQAPLLALLLALLPLVPASTARAQEIKLQPGLKPGTQIHLTEARDTAYCEITVVVSVAPRVSLKLPTKVPAQPLAHLYNTTGSNGLEGGCPAGAFADIDRNKLAEALNATDVYMNPTPQVARRYWVVDELHVYRAGETVNFMGVAATWVGAVPPEHTRNAAVAPYVGVEMHLESRFVYTKGSTLFLLRSPGAIDHGGKTWVMQSYTTEVDAELTLDQLAELGSKLNLPAGWSFETRRLEKNLTVDPRNAFGRAHIVRDELHNVYQGCGFDTACSFVP